MTTTGTSTARGGRPRRPRAWQTKVTVLGAAAVAAFVAYLFATSLLEALGLSVGTAPLDAYTGGPGSDEAVRMRNAHWYASAVLGLCLVASVSVVVGLWFRRPGARDAVYGVFGVPGFVLALLTFSGLAGSPHGGSAGGAAVVAAVLLVVTGLAASPGCGRDFARVAKDRELATREAGRARRTA